MSYINQYIYSQTFNYKQITKKTDESTPILRYMYINILMLDLSTIWQ